MRHRSYPKIGGTADVAGGPWVATEKLHGANFVIAVEHEVVRFGKRKAWLEPADAFFGWQLIAAVLAERVRTLGRLAPQVVCYGELFGGGYPHPDVPAVPGLTAIQTGVWYAPDLRWALFDILVATTDEDDGEMLMFAETEQLAREAGLLTAPVLARGKRADLERVPVAAPTAMPALLGLPPLADNRREGYVLKPDRRMAGRDRPIIKRKLPDFDDARFDEATSWDPGHLDLDQLTAWALRLVNPARVASARSKVGDDHAQIVDEIVLDVVADLELVFAAAWRSLGEVGETRVLDAVGEAARSMVAAHGVRPVSTDR